uniref:Uncharacterized protein n=1 Tax=Anopheles darlingi TaxID=43151 RepID=A0A2M4D5T5_ANODA
MLSTVWMFLCPFLFVIMARVCFYCFFYFFYYFQLRYYFHYCLYVCFILFLSSSVFFFIRCRSLYLIELRVLSSSIISFTSAEVLCPFCLCFKCLNHFFCIISKECYVHSTVRCEECSSGNKSVS